jgi:hypothetical protein
MACISEHTLELMAFNDSEESCHACGINASEIVRRYQCTEGCDNEYCGDCVDNRSMNRYTKQITSPQCIEGHKLVLTNMVMCS